jgi:hypothetical protein
MHQGQLSASGWSHGDLRPLSLWPFPLDTAFLGSESSDHSDCLEGLGVCQVLAFLALALLHLPSRLSRVQRDGRYAMLAGAVTSPPVPRSAAPTGG